MEDRVRIVSPVDIIHEIRHRFGRDVGQQIHIDVSVIGVKPNRLRRGALCVNRRGENKRKAKKPGEEIACGAQPEF